MNTQSEQLTRKTNRLAIISLTLGILGLFLSEVGGIIHYRLSTTHYATHVEIWPVLGCAAVSYTNLIIAIGLAGLITGVLAYRKINSIGENGKGKGIAITGIVLGILNCFASVIILFYPTS